LVLGILTYGVRVALVGLPQVLREGAPAALMLTLWWPRVLELSSAGWRKAAIALR
jgi:hypothetical protein